MARSVWSNSAGGCRRGGFTLVELTVVTGIILLVAGLLLTAYGAVTDSAKAARARAEVNSVAFGVESFVDQFGFIPPLVRDNPSGLPAIVGPLDTDLRARPNQVVPGFYLDGIQNLEDDYRVLTGEYFGADSPIGNVRNFSVYSLPYYVVGALPATHTLTNGGTRRALDGVDGPEFFPPQRTGGWEISTNIDASNPNDELRRTLDLTTFPSFIEVGDGGLTIERTSNAPQDPNQTPYRLELQDSNGVPIRYYRWADGRWINAGGGGDYEPFQDLPRNLQTIDALNVPDIFGDPANDSQNNFWDGGDPTLSPAFTNTELRGADYAIVHAGPDGVFGDEFLVNQVGAAAFQAVVGTVADPSNPGGFEEGMRVVAEALGLNLQRMLDDGNYAYDALVRARSDNVFQLGASR